MTNSTRSRSAIFILWVLIASLSSFFSIEAMAQVPTGATASGFTPFINNIISGTPGLNIANISGGGVTISQAGTATATASNGLNIPIATSATATIDKAALARGAAAVFRGAVVASNVVGIAVTGYAVYNVIKDLGIQTCPPPQFFCKPSTTGTAYQPDYSGGWSDSPNGVPGPYSTPIEVCNQKMQVSGDYKQLKGGPNAGYLYLDPPTFTRDAQPQNGAKESGYCAYVIRYTSNGGCYNGCAQQKIAYPMTFSTATGTCASGYTADAQGVCQPAPSGPYNVDPATGKDELADAIANASGWPNYDSSKAYKGITADAASLQNLADAFKLANPMTQWAKQPFQFSMPSSVSGPATVVSTVTVPQPDGTTHTKETTEQITMLPKPCAGGTLGDCTPTVTQQTTRTTVEKDANGNPIAGTATTTTRTDSTPAKNGDTTPQPQTCGLPGGLACNVKVDETGTPDFGTFDQNKDINTIDQSNKDRDAKVATVDATTTGLSKGWFPSFPTAACEDPQVPNLTGGQTAVPICAYVQVFSNFFVMVVAGFSIFSAAGLISYAAKA